MEQDHVAHGSLTLMLIIAQNGPPFLELAKETLPGLGWNSTALGAIHGNGSVTRSLR